MDSAAYPREKPWRVFCTVLRGGPAASPAGKIGLLCSLVLLWMAGAAILGKGDDLTHAAAAAGMALSTLTLLWLAVRFGALRATFLTRPGIELPADLAPHPLILPFAVTALGAAGLLGAILILNFAPAPAVSSALNLLLWGCVIAMLLIRLALRRMALRVAEDALIRLRGTAPQVLPLEKIDRVVWRAGRTGGEPDRLELSGDGMTMRLGGWHDRSDDHIRNLLRLILQPRLETAREQFRRAGFLACGPLRVYPDHFSRPEDTPPLRLPFALARSAHIDDQGRLAVEIEGRHEPLLLLGPDEYPLTPLVLRLISELWTVPAPPEENSAADATGGESGEESELVN